jgi:hypothetical protein
MPESRRAYAEALIEVSTLSMKAAAPVPALGIGDARQAFQRRLTMIMSERIPRRAPRWGLAAIALAGLATLPSWSRGQTPEIQKSVDMQLELQRLRAELEKTRAELAKAQADAAVYRDLKTVEERRAAQQAELAAQAEYRAKLATAHPGWAKQQDHATAAGLLALAQAGAELKRPWGPEQATGAPDTPEPGDFQTAWASHTPDGQDEWLQLDYAQKIQAVAILVYESHNPGAVTQITVSQPGNQHQFAWKAKDPTPVGNPSGVSVFPVPQQVDFTVTRVRLEIASTQVPGWNEIDAVGILDIHGKTHWATKATASSFYGQDDTATATRDARGNYFRSTTRAADSGTSARWTAKPDPNVTAETNKRLEKLEMDMAELKQALLEMRGLMRKDQGTRVVTPPKQ